MQLPAAYAISAISLFENFNSNNLFKNVIKQTINADDDEHPAFIGIVLVTVTSKLLSITRP